MNKPDRNLLCRALVEATAAGSDMIGNLHTAYYAYDNMSDIEVRMYLDRAKKNLDGLVAHMTAAFEQKEEQADVVS